MGTIDTICRADESPLGTGEKRTIFRLPIGSSRAAMMKIADAAEAWRCKRESRRALRDLTDDALRDIGLTRGEAMREVAKSSFWD